MLDTWEVCSTANRRAIIVPDRLQTFPASFLYSDGNIFVSHCWAWMRGHMYIRVEQSKGLNLEKLVGKEIIIGGIDVESGKYFETTISVYKNGAYLRIEEAAEPLPVKKKRAKRAKKMQLDKEDTGDGE